MISLFSLMCCSVVAVPFSVVFVVVVVAFVVRRRSFDFTSDRRVAARGREFMSVWFRRLVSSILHLLLFLCLSQ